MNVDYKAFTDEELDENVRVKGVGGVWGRKNPDIPRRILQVWAMALATSRTELEKIILVVGGARDGGKSVIVSVPRLFYDEDLVSSTDPMKLTGSYNHSMQRFANNTANIVTDITVH